MYFLDFILEICGQQKNEGDEAVNEFVSFGEIDLIYFLQFIFLFTFDQNLCVCMAFFKDLKK
jgi:hypothetical protein